MKTSRLPSRLHRAGGSVLIAAAIAAAVLGILVVSYLNWVTNEYRLSVDGIIQNGSNMGEQVMFARIDPGDLDDTTVELGLKYELLGFDEQDLLSLGNLEFETIKGGPKDQQNDLLNDEYDKMEAGSPYRATMGDTSKSEFGTQGLGNIYELDTLRGRAIPEPGSFCLVVTSLDFLGCGLR